MSDDVAKRLCCPAGVKLTIVVPVPSRPLLALKFETSTSPAAMAPPAGKLAGTNATPYGFKSPSDGIVDSVLLWSESKTEL
jgi:hypothetical protein